MASVEANGVEFEVLVMLDNRRKGRKARRVDEMWTARGAAEKASGYSVPGVDVDLGGTAANAYGYPAYTDAVVAVADRLAQIVYVWATEISANKATLRGAASVSPIPFLEDLYDRRTGDLREREARADILRWIRSTYVFPRRPRYDHLLSSEQIQVWTDGLLELGQ